MDPQPTGEVLAQQGPPRPVEGAGAVDTQQLGDHPNGTHPPVGAAEVLCGPLINYKHMSNATSASPVWHGTVLVVLTPSSIVEHQLVVRCVGPVGGASVANGSLSGAVEARAFPGVRLFEDPRKSFWRFSIDLPFLSLEARWEYTIPSLRTISPTQFCVPSATESMRIMFHSCNGFSVGTDVDAWSGPALWNDVLRMHAQKPFHVMLGGGDQIYNDGVRVEGPLKTWTDIANPKKRRDFPFPETLRRECDDYYFNNYVRWYGHEPFKTANGQIPQLNIWDDHDIIDGFGSYTDNFMRCSVFRGIGGVAHKYYLLFQHHIAPPQSTFTTDSATTMHAINATAAPDPMQLENTFILTETQEDPSYIIGSKPGPYVEERSRSIYCQLGARIAFAGIDARIERTRHQINYPETYDLIFHKISAELEANKNVKHLILLLGVPIAYPRLQWLENIFTSPIIAPIRLLNKRFGFAGGLFNKFDGQVDLLDDLDDHYTAHHHKAERKALVLRLQHLSKKQNVRISILGGDVHLAAIGRFYSNPKLGIPAERDWRYMPNIISSAITNKPPPQAVANLLARRNKIHHLDGDTDETLLELFDHDPGRVPSSKPIVAEKRTSDSNHATMPSRNYAIIAESLGAEAAAQHQHQHQQQQEPVPQSDNLQPPSLPAAAAASPSSAPQTPNSSSSAAPLSTTAHSYTNGNGNGTGKINPRLPIHAGEHAAGTQHPAAAGMASTGLCGLHGLDVAIRVEISNKDPEGRTEGYGFSIPALDAGAYAGHGTKW